MEGPVLPLPPDGDPVTVRALDLLHQLETEVLRVPLDAPLSVRDDHSYAVERYLRERAGIRGRRHGDTRRRGRP